MAPPFALRRVFHRQIPDISVEEKLGLGQQGAHAIQASNRQGGLLQETLAATRQIEGGIGGSGAGTKARTVSPPKTLV